MLRFVKYKSNLTAAQLREKVADETVKDEDLINIEPVRGIHMTITENNNIAAYYHSGGKDFASGRTCPYFYGKLKEKDGKAYISGVITLSVYLHIIVAAALVILLITEAFAMGGGSYLPLVFFACIFVLYMVVAVTSWLKSTFEISEIDNYLKSLQALDNEEK